MLKPDVRGNTLLSGLSAFWQTMFADRDQLTHLYAATEVQLGQAYLDLLTQVLNTSLVDIPVFNKEYWKLVVLRADRVRTGQDATYPYEHPLPTGVVSIPFLSNQVLEPTILLEQDVDYQVDTASNVIRFKQSPLDISGLATRSVTIVPTVYASGGGASWARATPNRLTVEGVLAAGKRAQTYGSDIVTVDVDTFNDTHVGDTLSLISVGGGPVTPTQVRTITEVLAPRQVRVSASVTADTNVVWSLATATRFTAQDVGTQVTVRDPHNPNSTQTATITSVVSGLVVELDQSLTLFDSSVSSAVGVAWTHQSKDRVTQAGLWGSDVLVDRDNLYLSFGSLLKRKATSSESYKALIRGIWRLFVEGPALSRIESALNLFVGIPVVQTSGEVVSIVDTASSATQDFVTTQVRRYAVPKGSLKASVVVGAALAAFSSLTDVFIATDAVQDPAWFYGKQVPSELIVAHSASTLPIDPQLYPNQAIVERPLILGEPNVFIGADETGRIVERLFGKDGDVGDVSTALVPALNPEGLLPHLAGRALTIGGIVDVLSSVDLSAALDAQLHSTIDINARLVGRDVAAEVEVGGVDIIRRTSGVAWSAEDVGRTLRIMASSVPSHVGEYVTITALLGRDRVAVVFKDTALTASLVTGETLTLKLLLDWEVKTRAGLRHNLGFNATRDILARHILYVSYDIVSYQVPYLRSEADVRQVLLAGKPSYIYLYLEAAAGIRDTLGIRDQVDIGFQPITQLVHTEPGIISGTPLGAYAYHAGSPFAWVDIVRDDALGGPAELSWADQADSLIFSAQFENWSPGDSIDVSVAAYNGVSFVPLGVAFTLDPAVSNVFTMPTGGTRIQVTTSVNGTATRACLLYGMAKNPAGTIVGFTPASYTQTTGSSAGGALFTDASFNFHDFDIYRELHIDLGGQRTRFWIRGISSPTSVYLINAETGAPAVIPSATGYSWVLGAPRRFATPAVISGPNVFTPPSSTLYANRLVDWPLAVLFSEPQNQGKALGTAVLTGTANATVS